MVRIYQGHALDVLKTLPDESVNCCVTSPPFWGLRDYGVEPLVWDAQEGCEHQWISGTSMFCQLCGAWYGSLGLEPTPDLFVSHLVQIFREVRRILTKDGTLWVNMGTSYAGSGVNDGKANPGLSKASQRDDVRDTSRPNTRLKGFKPKDLIGTPWMLAFALRSDGYYLRSDIIWNKPNPMPESVTDRPTKSHEYIFFLSKSRKYYYDYKAVKEPVSESSVSRLSQPTIPKQKGSNRVPFKTNGPMKAVGSLNGRNRRSVWTVTTRPYKGTHFATFPPKLIEPCIVAGCPEGGTVLDPFFGSGTTGIVAWQQNRRCIGIELNPEYITLAKNRIDRETRQLKLFGGIP